MRIEWVSICKVLGFVPDIDILLNKYRNSLQRTEMS